MLRKCSAMGALEKLKQFAIAGRELNSDRLCRMAIYSGREGTPAGRGQHSRLVGTPSPG